MKPSRFVLILNPDSDKEQRIPFGVCEGDIEDALDEGRAEYGDPFEKQIVDSACHKVLQLRVSRKVLDCLWTMEVNGNRSWGNIIR